MNPEKSKFASSTFTSLQQTQICRLLKCYGTLYTLNDFLCHSPLKQKIHDKLKLMVTNTIKSKIKSQLIGRRPNKVPDIRFV
jgi:hypothetical protein